MVIANANNFKKEQNVWKTNQDRKEGAQAQMPNLWSNSNTKHRK